MTPLLVFLFLIDPSIRPTDIVPDNITLTLAISASADVSREIQEAALIETAKIWAPYGVTISVLAASNHTVFPSPRSANEWHVGSFAFRIA